MSFLSRRETGKREREGGEEEEEKERRKEKRKEGRVHGARAFVGLWGP
jgi:hypothetical protein